MILEFLDVMLRVTLVIILALIFITLLKIERHQNYIHAYLSDSERLEVQITNP